jgi:sugar phosphate isomerase/epimerase
MPPILQSEKATTKLLQMAKHSKIRISFESNPVRSYLLLYPLVTRDPDKYAAFCIKNKLPMTMDVSHISHHDYSIVDFFKKYHNQITLIHLSDYKNGQEHLPLGKGSLPIKEFLQVIKKNNWNGQITFEIGNIKNLSSKKEKFNALRDSLLFVRKYI